MLSATLQNFVYKLKSKSSAGVIFSLVFFTKSVQESNKGPLRDKHKKFIIHYFDSEQKLNILKKETPSDEQSPTNPSDDNTDKLIDHAKALIDRAKTFITKLVGCKHGSKHPTISPVEMDVKPKALDVLHGQTMNKLTPLHVETDGSSRPSDADSNIPKCRKINGKMCTEIFTSVKDLKPPITKTITV